MRQLDRRSDPSRSPRRLRRLALLALALTVFASAIAWRDTNVPRLRTVSVPVPGLSRTMRILHVSDLHGARFGPGQQQLAELLRSRRYDAAVITGDVARGEGSSIMPAVELTTLLLAHADMVVSVPGNHDSPDGMEALVQTGALPIERSPTIATGPAGNGEIVFVHASRVRPRALHPDARGYPLIVAVDHIPPQGTTLAQLEGVNGATVLAVAGHTHAGQIRLPLIGAVWAPYGWATSVRRPQPGGLFPDIRGRFISGLYRRGSLYVHTSPGLGTTMVRARFLNQAEMTEIVLRPE